MLFSKFLCYSDGLVMYCCCGKNWADALLPMIIMFLSLFLSWCPFSNDDYFGLICSELMPFAHLFRLFLSWCPCANDVPEMAWYVVYCGRQTGVFSTWEECHAQVNDYKGACYMGYKSKDDAFASFYCGGKREFNTVLSHPTKSSFCRDVIILAQAVIIIILICIIFYFLKIA